MLISVEIIRARHHNDVVGHDQDINTHTNDKRATHAMPKRNEWRVKIRTNKNKYDTCSTKTQIEIDTNKTDTKLQSPKFQPTTAMQCRISILFHDFTQSMTKACVCIDIMWLHEFGLLPQGFALLITRAKCRACFGIIDSMFSTCWVSICPMLGTRHSQNSSLPP